MDSFFKNRYYRVNRLSLVILGVWPYQKVAMRAVKGIFMFIIFLITLIAMMTKVLTTESTVDFITYALQFAVPSTIFFLDLCYFSYNMKKMQILLEHIKHDWDLLQAVESKILEKFANESRLYTHIFTAMAVVIPIIHVVGIVFVGIEEVSDANDTKLELSLPMEYFFDHRKYYTYVILHVSVHIAAGLLLAVSIGTLYLAQIYHACGMFAIAGHRLKTMFDDFKEEIFIQADIEIVLKNTFRIIMLHNRTITFTNAINSLYAPIYLVELSLQVILLSSDILRLIQAITVLNDYEMALTCVVHIISVLLTTCMFAYTGQKLLDHSSGIHRKVYESRWYVAPLKMQKLLLLIMMRSLKESAITITKSITVSYEMLASVLQMSMSYFMALYSLR